MVCVFFFEVLVNMSALASRNILLSIVIPHFERWKCIHELLENIPSVDPGFRVEIIFVDDASEKADGKAAFNEFWRLVEFSWLNIRFIAVSTNSGASFCRNLGYKNSTGRFVHFLDSDDNLHWRDYFLLIGAIRDSESSSSAFVSGSDSFLDPSKVLAGSFIRAFNWIGPLSGVVFCRDKIDTITFDESLESAQDWAFYVDCFDQQDFSFSRVGFDFFSYTNSSDSITCSKTKFLSGRLRFYQKYFEQDRGIRRLTFFSGLIIFALRRRMVPELFKFFAKLISNNPSVFIQLVLLPWGMLLFMALKVNSLIRRNKTLGYISFVDKIVGS